MRLLRAYVRGFKNLAEVNVDFDQSKLTTVVIGQNGTGKSNLVESLVSIFRFVDLNRGEPVFVYEIEYQIGAYLVQLNNRSGRTTFTVNGAPVSRAEFERRKAEWFPDLVFGYYSGGSRRLERLFDAHQRRYYDSIKLNENAEECRDALGQRRLFYCRPIHGVFALLAAFAYPEEKVLELLRKPLGILGFHSALALFREPWFSQSARNKKDARPENLWGAKGPAGTCARSIRDVAFHPLALEDKTLDDYRDKGGSESQYAAFIRDEGGLLDFASRYKDDQDLFAALEAMDISDLIREFYVWVLRLNDQSGDVSFADLSDGERQLLMVLGLIRVSRNKRALFLLDEPDTHLNPIWQHSYLDLIRQWTGVTGDEANCQIVMTSHNPLTIAALKKEEVRVMFADDHGRVSISPPYADPQGMGFTATLTEIFGLPTTLDPVTQKALDDRNTLARIDKRTEKQERDLATINDQLSRLGFMFEDREPLYQDFLRALHEVRYTDRSTLSPEQSAAQHAALVDLVRQIQQKKKGQTQ